MYKLIGRKKEMTQSFGEDWKLSPVVMVDISRNVLAKSSKERVWIGFGRKENPNKAQLGTFKKLGYVPAKVIETDASDYEGKSVRDSIIKKELLGAKIEVTGVSKGKGFAGGHKRFDIKGGPSTRGQSTTQRKIGSVGSQTPGRVYKGVKMPGHMGHVQVTVKNLKVVFLDEKSGIIGIKGHVPGGRNSIVTIKVREWGKPEEEKPEEKPAVEPEAKKEETKKEEAPNEEVKKEAK